MGLSDRDYMQERAKQRACGQDQARQAENDKVKDAHYHPKEFRGERLRIKIPNWRRDGWEDIEASSEGQSASLGTLYFVFLVGTVFGFFVACLLGLLRFELFGWGIQVMKPIAVMFSKI